MCVKIIYKIIALLLFIMVMPLLIFFSVCLLIEDPTSSPFFSQIRIGKDGEEFKLFKLRSMRTLKREETKLLEELNEAGDRMFKIKQDPRVTTVGRVIRKTSIDELPQLLNVIKGEMSLVGPRPPLPNEVAEYNEEEWKRMSVLPGCTGLWQINGRSDVSFEGMLYWDLLYIEKKSFLYDMKILLKTIPVVISMKGAY